MYQIDFNHPSSIYFVGIGGISMSGLAEILKDAGFRVSGSDRSKSPLTETLERKGINVFYGQRAGNITDDIDCVVFTSAIHKDNPEYVATMEKGIPHLTRAQLLGEIMQNYKTPIAISGTHGKTTTTYLVEHIASVAGNRCGVIGTVGNKIAGVMEHAERTTPESPDLQKLFARMRDAGCTVVAMEVSSHALDLRRTWDTDFAVTAFTNLTQDHLDYHHTFDDYFEAKALLFSKDYPARRVISIDGSWGRELLRRCTAAGDEVITTGFDVSAQIHPVEVTYEAARTKAVLEVLPDLDWKPDVINCNDWQTALVPVYYNLMFASRPFYENLSLIHI